MPVTAFEINKHQTGYKRGMPGTGILLGPPERVAKRPLVVVVFPGSSG